MMKGVDVSNWQKGIKPSSLGVDFCICKATEGANFVDQQCDGYIQDCIAHDLLWGFYHFAGSNEPEDEARFFHEHTKGYTGHGIPVLDYEAWGSNSDVAWCERFLDAYHDLTGIWAMFYISASHCKDFSGSWIPEKCGLWVAGYPWHYTSWPVDSMPYPVKPWSFCAIWQFTSSLRLPAWAHDLDGDYAYMDDAAWARYAGSSNVVDKPSAPDYEKLANEVLAGEWGNGEDRKTGLDANYGAGTYEKVQAIVNRKLSVVDYEKLANEVIRGMWGNGWNRKQALNNAYGAGTYDKVQAIVNARLKKS